MARGYSEIRPQLAENGAQNMGADSAQLAILEAVAAGDFVPMDLISVTTKHPALDITARFRMSKRALRLGRVGDSKRVAVTHATTQAVADLLGLRVPTADLLDQLVETLGVDAEPIPTPDVATMAQLSEAEAHSDALDVLGSRWDNVKAWINHPRLLAPQLLPTGKASGINYGWATMGKAQPQGTPGPKRAARSTAFRVLQEPGAAHNVKHTDRSQMLLGLVHPGVIVSTGGIEALRSIDDIAIDPILHPLVSIAGPMPMRHPWLPECVSFGEGGCATGGAVAGSGGAGPSSVPVLARVAPVLLLAVLIAYVVTR